MTCREKLAMEHPDMVKSDHGGGCYGCPSDYGYLDTAHESCDTERPNCVKCWDREIPEETPRTRTPIQKAYDLMVGFVHEGKTTDLEEVIGYLGEALDDHPECAITVNSMETEYPCTNCNMGWGSIGADGSKSCHDDCDRLRRYYDNPEPTIKDSGDRTQFASGAVRDMRAGKGRCDLMPLEVVANYICDDNDSTDTILWSLKEFLKTNSTSYLYSALNTFDALVWNCPYTMMLEVAKHYEDGAKKYGENNWQKGMPTWCYIDSAIRHYLKLRRGDQDEPHDRAFVWNLLCCIWEVDYRDKEEPK